MKTWTTDESVTTLRLCNVCKDKTPHEIHAGDGCTAYICIPCRQRSELHELTRE
jgi:hypothetical protein